MARPLHEHPLVRWIVAFLYIAVAGCGGGGGATPADAAIDNAPPIDAPDLGALCGVTPGAAWQRCHANPLVEGMRPAADAGKIEWTQADPTVLYDADDHLWKAWWSTVIVTDCSQITTPNRELDIKYAESDDGVAWRIQAEPVLRSHRDPGDWDYSTAETPTVIKVPGAVPARRYALIYAGGNDNVLKVLGQTGWQLGVAFSADGKQFTRISATESPYAGQSTPFARIEGLALLAKDAFPSVTGVDHGIIADPEVIAYGGKFHLYFSSVAVDAQGALVANTYGISHATSTDLVHWTAATGNPIPALYGGGQPTILADGNQLTMYFGQDSNADLATIPSALFPTLGFWKATSSDASTWTRLSMTTRDFTWLPSDTGEDLGLLNGAAIARGPDGNVRLYYGGWGTKSAPAGSCVYVYDRTKTPATIVSVPGTNDLLLAIRR